jgi:hypothetical protein
VENLLAEYFGRTPINTPAASQVSDHEDQLQEEPADGVVNLEEGMMQFLDETNISDTDTDTDASEEEQVFRRSTHVGNIHLPDDPLARFTKILTKGFLFKCNSKNSSAFTKLLNKIIRVKFFLTLRRLRGILKWKKNLKYKNK